MKILIIGGLASSLINFRKELILNLKKNNHSVLTCAGEIDENTKNELSKLKIDYESYYINRHSISILNNLYTFIGIYKIINKFKPNIIIPYTIKPVIFSSIIARYMGIKIYPIITGLGYIFLTNKLYVRFFLKKVIKFLYKISFKKTEIVFFQNKDDHLYFKNNKIISMQTRSIITGGSGVNLERFQFTEINKKNYSFLMVSRLLPEKGVIEYLNVAKKLKKKFPNLIFNLIGSFEKNNSSNHYISKLITESSVNYLDYKKDVRPFIKKCSVIVLPSYREGMPRTILEGMAMGRAIITTDVPGCRDTVIDGYNGYKIQKKNELELEEAILKICDFKKIQEMGRNSREIAIKKFDVNVVNNLIISQIVL